MTLDEQLNALAGWIAFATIVPLLVGIIAYGFGSPWYDSWLGRITLTKWISVFAIFLFIASRRMFGEYVGYGAVALALYLVFFLSYSAMAIIVIVEQRSPSPGVFPEKGSHYEQFQYPPEPEAVSDAPLASRDD